MPFFALPVFLSSLFASPHLPEHDLSFNLLPSNSSFNLSPSLQLPNRVPNPADIPLEIIISILELLYHNDNLQVDIDMLKTCSLVSRAWSVPAQKLLFRHVTLQNQRSLESFIDAIDRSTSRGCMLGDAVHSLRVTMDHNQPSGIHQHSFALGVTLCPNLRELNLSLYGCAAPGSDVVGAPDQTRMMRPAPLFDEHTIQILKSGPAITALEFNNWSDNEQSTTQLLEVWPSLKSLAITGTIPHISSESSEPLPCALTNLRLNLQKPPSADFMDWLLYNSSQTLRQLEFEREPPIQLLEYLTSIYGPTLHSLSLPSFSSPKQAFVKQCTGLREIKTESPSVLSAIYRELPETLEHMAFGMDRDSSLHSIIEAVKSKNSLKSITALLWTGGELHTHLSKLKIQCAWRGVDLKVTNDIRTFRLMTRGSPITSQM